MGLFFSSDKGSLSREEIDELLRKQSILENTDKEEIKRRLKKRKAGGITKRDIIEVTRDLKQDTSDSINTAEAESARRQLLDELEKDDG